MQRLGKTKLLEGQKEKQAFCFKWVLPNISDHQWFIFILKERTGPSLKNVNNNKNSHVKNLRSHDF